MLYYLKKQIAPALKRTVGLVPGVDVDRWLSQLPHGVRMQPTKRLISGSGRDGGGDLFGARIDSFYLTKHCAVCDSMTNQSDIVCDNCAQTPGKMQSEALEFVKTLFLFDVILLVVIVFKTTKYTHVLGIYS